MTAPGLVDARIGDWPSLCCSPSPASVVLPAVAADVAALVAVGGVVDVRAGMGGGQDRRMAVHVLQPLAGERRLAGRRTEDEALGHLVAGRPEEVAGALEPEHRVEDVERDHRVVVRGVRGARRGECGGGGAIVDVHVLYLAGGGIV